MNIRIGNDAILNISLDFEQMQNKQILEAVCYLLDVDRDAKKHEHKEKCDPEKPAPTTHIPTDYTIHGHVIPEYNYVFGANPHGRGFTVCEPHCCPCCDNKHHDDPFKYVVNAAIISNTQIQCVFPGKKQSRLGRYKLIVETTVRDTNGIYTYTFDFGTVLSLTDKPFGKIGEVIVNVPNLDGSILSIDSISKTIAILQNSSLTLGSDDKYGFKYAILVTTLDGSVVAYSPENWSYSNVKFKSSNPEVVSIDENGTITAAASKIGRDVVITAYDEDDLLVSTSIIVHVVGSDSDYTSLMYSTQIYDPLNEMNQSEVNSAVLAGIHAVENLVGKTVDGMFIVVTSQANYDRWASINLIKNDTFYFTYDEEEYPDGPDGPIVPTPTGVYVENHVLYTNGYGTVSAGILTIGGSVNNNTLNL